MFRIIYWMVAAALLLVLPGLSILMAACYVAFIAVSAMYRAARPTTHARHAEAGTAQSTSPESTEIAAPSPTAGQEAAELFAEEARLMAEEREEHELLAHNAAHQEASDERSQLESAVLNDEQSWQDRLENGYRP